MTGQPLKLAVGYPWSSPFMFTAFVDATLNMRHPEGCEVRYFRGEGWCPARRHYAICEKAIAWGADLILIIGTDQVHPEDMLCRLMARYHEGCDVITAMVPARAYIGWQDMKPFQPMAWRLKRDANGNRVVCPPDGMISGEMMEPIDPDEGDLLECDFIGSGVLMFPADVLRGLKHPWFFESVDPTNMQRLANMDCNFVWRLRSEAFCRVFVDTTIKVKHAHVFNVDETFQDRFRDWMTPGIGDSSICRFQPIRGDSTVTLPQTAGAT
jgi:hypothetical protein